MIKTKTTKNSQKLSFATREEKEQNPVSEVEIVF